MSWFIYLLATIGALALVAIIVIGGIGISLGSLKNRIPRNIILEIDFENGLAETVPHGLLNRIATKEQLQIRDVVSALEFAAKDKRVKGIIAHCGGGPFSFADVQEIRSAVLQFRKSGKVAFAFAESFGEGSSGNSLYYLASAFDSIFMQPSGAFEITGILTQSQFFKGTLDKLDIKTQLGAREEYKTARNQFTETQYTAPHKEMAESIIKSIQKTFQLDIADARKIDSATVQKLIAEGPLSAQQAVTEKLIDALEYRDQVYDRIKTQIGKKSSFFYFSKYMARLRPQPFSKKNIALIIGDGTITQGKSRYNPLTGEKVMGARTLSAAFRAAIRDKSVGAIVLRVNSPGGSYIGSDMIWRETLRAKKAGKPLIVSMGAVAGSGGYFISVNADKIVAHPSTITGSIGVVAGKIVTTGFYNKLGISFDRVFTDSNATTFLNTTEYTAEQWENLQKTLDRVYSDFVGKVAAGRKITEEKVREIAKGRVYTGVEALNIGLVDTLGGFREAFVLAKSMMGLPADKAVRIKRFPRVPTLWEQILGKGPESSEDASFSVIEDVSILDAGLIEKIISFDPGIFMQQRLLMNSIEFK